VVPTGPAPKLSIMAKNVRFLMKNVPFASKKAEEHYQKAIELSEEIGANGYRGISYLGLGQFYQAKKKTDKARQCINRAIEILAECKSENGKRFQIKIAGERIQIPANVVFNIEHEREVNAEEVEFQFKLER
jgi:tetratricopeptide (TPR) repeat protein